MKTFALLALLTMFSGVGAFADGISTSVPPRNIFIHCVDTETNSHFTLDTITGRVSFQKSPQQPITHYVKVIDQLPSPGGPSSGPSVQYLNSLQFEDSENARDEDGKIAPRPIQYLVLGASTELNLNPESKVACSFITDAEKGDGIAGLKCKFQNAGWKSGNWFRRSPSQLTLILPLQGHESALPPSSSAVILNKEPTVFTFNPGIEWVLQLQERDDGTIVPSNESCTVFQK